MLEELLELIRALIEKKDTVMKEAIPARDRLCVTLRYLATGNSRIYHILYESHPIHSRS